MKDSKRKTKIHAPNCPNFGSHSKRKCRWPTRLAAGTVNSTNGKLRVIFDAVGRTGDWSGLSPGNPAAHPSVKKYLVSISEEQAKAKVSPRQAVPFFFDKSTKLCTYLRNRIFLSSLSPLEKYIISCDLAFFCLDFYSGNRASDLGRVYTKDVLLLPEDQGLLFHHTFGMTLRGKDFKNQLQFKRCPQDTMVCPVCSHPGQNQFALTLVRVFLCPCVGPFPSVGLRLTWFIWGINLALHITLYSVKSVQI